MKDPFLKTQVWVNQGLNCVFLYINNKLFIVSPIKDMTDGRTVDRQTEKVILKFRDLQLFFQIVQSLGLRPTVGHPRH